MVSSKVRGADHPSEGVVYVATGLSYAKLFLQSVHHLREVEPDVPVMLATDEQGEKFCSAFADRYRFSLYVIEKPAFSFFDKVSGIALSPFEKTIFLDCDVIPVAAFTRDLFLSLDYYSVVALPGMSLNHDWELRYSAALSQFNTGVVGLRFPEASRLLKRWRTIYSAEFEPGHDQPSFRAALIEEGLSCGPLGAEFNYMGSGFVSGARIIHFTAFRRLQPYYQSELARTELLKKFADPNTSGTFIDFSEAGSPHAVRGKGVESKLSWWLFGAWNWVYFRTRRYLVGFWRRLWAFMAQLKPKKGQI